jgi:serine/threonine protein kinase
MMPSHKLNWDRAAELFQAALEQPMSTRAAWVEAQSAYDRATRDEVKSLLTAERAHQDLCALQQAADPPPSPPERISERLGPYRTESLLGRGGMSAVYLARRVDGQFEQTVALKVLAAHLAGEEFAQRLRVERQLLANLTHPNITRLLDGGVSAAGDPYLVMEYVEGQLLDRYCDHAKLTIQARIRLFLQVCEAVDFAHRNLVLHRDLKPGNILVTSEGAVKLLDFGTASLMAEHPDKAATGARMMTPRYASPEQLRGERITIASDIFSLGVVAYELVAGSWPFGDPNSLVSELRRAVGDSSASLPHAAVTEEIAARRSITREHLARMLRSDLAAILLKCLHPDPAQRYRSVRNLEDDLRAYLCGRPVTARSLTLAYRTRRFVARNRWRVVFAAAMLAIIAIAAAYGIERRAGEQRRLAQLRELDQSYLTEIYREVATLAGSSKARLLIVDRTRKNLDQLLAEQPEDRKIRQALAEAYIQFADIQGEPFTISLGDTAGALESYRKAERLALSLGSASSPAVGTVVRARLGIAQIQVRAGQYAEAVKTLEAVIQPARSLWESGVQQEVAGRSPATLYLRANVLLGHAMLRAADVDRSVPGVKQALSQFQQTVSLAEQMDARDPGSNLAGMYSEYAGYASELLGDFTGDRQYYRTALSYFERYEAAARKNLASRPSPKNERDVADALVDLGWCWHLYRSEETALQALSEALVRMEPVSRADPDSREARQDLASVNFRLGAVEISSGQLASGMAHLRTAQSMVVLPAHIQSTDRETVVLFANIQEQLAAGHLTQKDSQAAARALSLAVESVKNGSSVPPWRVEELARELRNASQQ